MISRSTKYLCLVLVLFAFAIGLTSCGSPASNNGSTVTQKPSPSPSASPSPTPTCSANDDRNIEKAISVAVTANSTLNGVRLQFNWASKTCEVHLIGWTGTADIRNEMIKIVGNTAKVEKINIQYFVIAMEDFTMRPDEEGAGCPTGWEPCDRICVPLGHGCINRPTTGTPTPSPAVSPSPSASKP